MLWTIFVALLLLWLISVVLGQFFGGWVHVLLLMALTMLVARVLGSRSRSR